MKNNEENIYKTKKKFFEIINIDVKLYSIFD